MIAGRNLRFTTAFVFVALCCPACAKAPAGTGIDPPADSLLLDDPAAVESEELIGWRPRKPLIPPRVAMLAGLLPLRTLGIDTFRASYPEFDGRGVVIAIMDNGVEPGVAGLTHTSTGEPKILDLRDFSGQGRVPLVRVESFDSDTITVGGSSFSGMRELDRLADAPIFAGVFRERDLGTSGAADVNGNGHTADEFLVVVLRRGGEWAVVTDTDGNGSFAGERVVRDYAVAGEVFSYGVDPNATDPGPLTIAINIDDGVDAPVLDFFFDDSGHGTHVAGIAAGHDLFDVDGFDGVAPGAQLIGLKIADNSRGGISVGGSVVNAMEYAVSFAEEHDLSLVINMSHGIGNEVEGAASLDSIIDDFSYENPDVLFVVSAGNEGPGISSVGFPGSAQQALSVCALFPPVFFHGSSPNHSYERSPVAHWSARGGEVAKPDLCAPGKAFSVVPRWHSGKEVLEGTSQAAPQIAGAASLLLSAMRARNVSVRAVEVTRSLKNTAKRPPGLTALDVGAGVPNVSAALQWLAAGHQAGTYSVHAVADEDLVHQGSAAFRRSGLTSPADTVQRFIVSSVGGQPAARLLLESDVDWIRAPRFVEPRGAPVTIDLVYDQSQLQNPGIYVGTVFAKSATDTVAGPLFELVNTVVVPHGLSPGGYKHELKSGTVRRHFFNVPANAGGLEVVVRLADPSSKAMLHLFDPEGRPVRGQGGRSVGGLRSSSASIAVGVEALVPGVYEAVVAAPPAETVAYGFEVAIPDVAVESVGDGPVATIRNLSHRSVRAIVTAEVIGASSHHLVEGRGSERAEVRVVPPQWADRMLLKVFLRKKSWNQITGFGVTVFDTAGVLVSDGPLNYSGARQIVQLDSVVHSAGLDVELLPAFARADAQTSWTAELEVVFLLPNAVELTTSDGSNRTGVLIAPQAVEEVDFVLQPDWGWIDQDLLPLVEVTARLPVGPPSFRRDVAVPRRSVVPR